MIIRIIKKKYVHWRQELPISIMLLPIINYESIGDPKLVIKIRFSFMIIRIYSFYWKLSLLFKYFREVKNRFFHRSTFWIKLSLNFNKNMGRYSFKKWIDTLKSFFQKVDRWKRHRYLTHPPQCPQSMKRHRYLPREASFMVWLWLALDNIQ